MEIYESKIEKWKYHRGPQAKTHSNPKKVLGCLPDIYSSSQHCAPLEIPLKSMKTKTNWRNIKYLSLRTNKVVAFNNSYSHIFGEFLSHGMAYRFNGNFLFASVYFPFSRPLEQRITSIVVSWKYHVFLNWNRIGIFFLKWSPFLGGYARTLEKDLGRNSWLIKFECLQWLEQALSGLRGNKIVLIVINNL